MQYYQKIADASEGDYNLNAIDLGTSTALLIAEDHSFSSDQLPNQGHLQDISDEDLWAIRSDSPITISVLPDLAVFLKDLFVEASIVISADELTIVETNHNGEILFSTGLIPYDVNRKTDTIALALAKEKNWTSPLEDPYFYDVNLPGASKGDLYKYTDYHDIDKTTEKITHTGIYIINIIGVPQNLGNGLLNTTQVDAGRYLITSGNPTGQRAAQWGDSWINKIKIDLPVYTHDADYSYTGDWTLEPSGITAISGSLKLDITTLDLVTNVGKVASEQFQNDFTDQLTEQFQDIAHNIAIKLGIGNIYDTFWKVEQIGSALHDFFKESTSTFSYLIKNFETLSAEEADKKVDNLLRGSFKNFLSTAEKILGTSDTASRGIGILQNFSMSVQKDTTSVKFGLQNAFDKAGIIFNSPSDMKTIAVNISGKAKFTGGLGKDRLFGYADMDTLDGGTGADSLAGGLGNDTYFVDNAGDVVTETSTSLTEIDTVYSSITFTLGSNLEKLTLTGKSVINGTGNTFNNNLTGNSANNNLDGLAGNDTINGGKGNDILIGGTGKDKMTGGLGNDTYSVDNSGDVVIETSTLLTEIDTVNSSITYTLTANVEKLTLTGTAALNGTGNGLNNTLTGNTSANILNGLAGNDVINGGGGIDILIGGAGKDTLTGGLGKDTFDFNAYSEMGLGATKRDVITDFTRGQDKIDLSSIDPNTALAGNQAFKFITTPFNAPGQLHYSNGIISINTDTDSATEYEIQLTGVIPTKLAATDFVV